MSATSAVPGEAAVARRIVGRSSRGERIRGQVFKAGLIGCVMTGLLTGRRKSREYDWR